MAKGSGAYKRSAAERRHKFVYQYGKCYYCGLTVEQREPPHPRAATLDHLLPLSKGGKSAMSNLVLACFRCNNEKGDLTETEYRRFRYHLVRGKTKKQALRCVHGDSSPTPTIEPRQDAPPDGLQSE